MSVARMAVPNYNLEPASRLAFHVVGEDGAAHPSVAQQAVSLVPSHIYPPEVVLFQQGDAANHIYFIERGLVKLNRIEQNGHQVIVGLRPAGRIIGASTAILQKPHPVSATTLTDCHIRQISAEAFRNLLKTDVQFSWHIQHSQSSEAHEYISRIAQASCLSARQRLEELLWELICVMELGHQEKLIRLDVPLKQWEIAQLIGVSPEHLCRMLKVLEEEGLVCRRKGWLRINDAQRLHHSSDSQ